MLPYYFGKVSRSLFSSCEDGSSCNVTQCSAMESSSADGTLIVQEDATPKNFVSPRKRRSSESNVAQKSANGSTHTERRKEQSVSAGIDDLLNTPPSLKSRRFRVPRKRTKLNNSDDLLAGMMDSSDREKRLRVSEAGRAVAPPPHPVESVCIKAPRLSNDKTPDNSLSINDSELMGKATPHNKSRCSAGETCINISRYVMSFITFRFVLAEKSADDSAYKSQTPEEVKAKAADQGKAEVSSAGMNGWIVCLWHRCRYSNSSLAIFSLLLRSVTE